MSRCSQGNARKSGRTVQATATFRAYQRRIAGVIDRRMSLLLAAEWVGAVLLAVILTPKTWTGARSSVHPHVVAALLLGPAVVLVPAFLAFRYSGRIHTRHIIAIAQMMMSSLLIEITGGRIETHFHIFGSLAFLAFYRDWRVLITASAVTGFDHMIRGLWWPWTIYGVYTVSPWRWLEHVWWVAFEDFFLIVSFRQAVREMWIVARREVRLSHGASHDVLTGLGNRRLLQERYLAVLEDPAKAAAVFYVDLDRFKQVNDNLGHAVGDKLLVSASERLSAVIRKSDTVARVGGDEFVILTEGASEQAVQRTAERILSIFNEPFVIEEHRLLLSASVGVSLAPEHGTTLEELQAAADLAMYEAKSQGRGRWRLYSVEVLERERNRRVIETDLSQALARNELDVYFQPQLRGDETLTGFEALVRWKHPQLGFVSPAEFIPAAESSGLILEIGEWVLKRACERCRQWHDAGYPELRVAVNVSAIQFEQPEFYKTVDRILGMTGLHPGRLTLELTETALMQNVVIASGHLKKLRSLGVEVALDDFGTGYASLRYMEALPATSIKLDSAFIGRTASDQPRMLRSVIELAHRNGLAVTAEGVETAEQSQILREMDCDYLQGYYFGHPMNSNAVFDYLASHTACGHSQVQLLGVA